MVTVTIVMYIIFALHGFTGTYSCIVDVDVDCEDYTEHHPELCPSTCQNRGYTYTGEWFADYVYTMCKCSCNPEIQNCMPYCTKKPTTQPTWNVWPTPQPVEPTPEPTPYPTQKPTPNPTSKTAKPTTKTAKPTGKPTHAPTPMFKCYNWTEADMNMGMPEEERCMTAGFGFLYTRGDERLAPGCGDCHCCQPVHPPALQFKCYHYTSQDWQYKEEFGWSEEDLCIQHTGWGHVYSNGDSSVAPGCGRCDCCVPDVPTPEKYECYHYTDEDLAYQKRHGISDARMCLTAGLGFGYQPDVDFPSYAGCDSQCECCQPTTYSGTAALGTTAATRRDHLPAPTPRSSVDTLVESAVSEHTFTCYHYTEKDLAMTSLPESERCLTAGWGFVYTAGDDSLAPGCGRCSCCQPVKEVETPLDRCFSCYHYTTSDWALVEAGLPEKAMCETRGPGFVYSQGNDSIAPGCDRCWCCRPEAMLPGAPKFGMAPKCETTTRNLLKRL